MALRCQENQNKSFNLSSGQLENNTSKLGERNESSNSRRNNQNENDLQLNNTDLISRILKQFQALQINLSLPLFDPDNSNPMEFIRNFEKYCIRKNILDGERLLVVEDALQGSTKIWYVQITLILKIYFLKDSFQLKRACKRKMNGRVEDSVCEDSKCLQLMRIKLYLVVFAYVKDI